MAKTVYKYPLMIDDYQRVALPKGAQILCIKMQRGKPYLWALVDPEEMNMEEIHIRCAGTGHSIRGQVEYIDTVLTYGESLVFHFFKVV